jgi:GT2 family glycosyltransferase
MSAPAAGERVSAVIVHYRTPAETLRAARAVAATAPAAEIVVVDNASRDGIERLLAAQVPSARVLTEDANRGFGAACNRGARETARPYLLFLNSDAFVKPGAVVALEAALDTERRAAAVGPRLVNANGSLQASLRLLPTPWRIFCESSGLAFLSGGRRPFEGHTATRQDHSGRREALEDVGGFDEAFFLYAEETDLMARWRKRRWTLLYEPRAEVVHEGGRSGGDALFGQLHASLVRYAGKHHGPAAARFSGAVLDAGAALRYAAALVTPGARGKSRRRRYRSAMQRRSAAAAVPVR